MLNYDEEKKEESNATSQPSAPAQQAANPAVSPSQQPAWTQWRVLYNDFSVAEDVTTPHGSSRGLLERHGIVVPMPKC